MATRGVVQLFNAVRDRQRTLRERLGEAGRSDRKRERVFREVDREGFLDVLEGKEGGAGGGGGAAKRRRRKEETDRAPTVKEEPSPAEESSWKILREDFMMGARMRDWDKDGSDSE